MNRMDEPLVVEDHSKIHSQQSLMMMIDIVVLVQPTGMILLVEDYDYLEWLLVDEKPIAVVVRRASSLKRFH